MEIFKKYLSLAIKIVIVFPIALLTVSTVFFGIVMVSSGVAIDWGQTFFEISIKILIGSFFYWVANKLYRTPNKPRKVTWQHSSNISKSNSDWG